VYLHGHNFRGQTHSSETKERLRKIALEQSEERSERMKGENNPMWRDGHREKYNKERLDSGFNSYQRRKTRKRLIKERGRQCERCETTADPLELHHIDHDLYHNNDDNLLLVCRSCQMKYTAEFIAAQR
jgi:methionyl-tRNA synthetase